MHIQFNCPSCSKSYKVPASKAGGVGRCVCGNRLQVPDAAPPPFAAPIIVPEAPPTLPKRKSFERTGRLVPLPLVVAISLAVVAINIAGTYLYVSSFKSQTARENKAAESKHAAEMRAAREEVESLLAKAQAEYEKVTLLSEEADAAVAKRDREIAELNAKEQKILNAQAELAEAERVLAEEKAKDREWLVRVGQLSPARQQRLKDIDAKISNGEKLTQGDLKLMEEVGGRAGEAAARIRQEQGVAAGGEGLFDGAAK